MLSPASVRAARSLRTLSGSHTRAVWSRQQKGHDDWQGMGSHLKLMGIDSDDGRGERAIVARTGCFTCPIITPNGERVIYTDNKNHCVNIVDWNGRNHRTLLKKAYALCVWREPGTGTEWVCVRPNNTLSWVSKSHPVVMRQIDHPRIKRLLWDKGGITWNWFQMSPDGRRAAICGPWPRCGMVTLPNGTLTVFDKGCWTAMAPDESYRMWVFHVNHRQVKLYDKRRKLLTHIDIARGEGIKGWEVYHPRWSNNPRVISVTGPYSRGSSKAYREEDKGIWITKGGRNVELHIGRLNADLTRVERWVRVTRNAKADFFGDVWVAPDNV